MNKPWTKDIEALVKEFQTDFNHGLTEEKVASKLKEFGLNKLESKKRIPAYIIFFRQFKNPVIYILLVAVLITIYLNEWLDSAAILAIVILNSVIGFIQEYKTESSIEALSKLSSPEARVLRNSKIVSVSSENITPGDILVLEAGDYVVADARLVSVAHLSTDEAALTGESMPVEKTLDPLDEETGLADRTNLVFAGTAVAHGSGKAVVTATGRKTEIGKIADKMDQTQFQETPLQLKLGIVSKKLIYLGLGVIAVVVALGFFRKEPFTDVLVNALAIAISAIPEGLPTVVSIALVMAVRRMSKKRALVRKLHSVETLGATDIICTDKTGTLTTGKMSVKETSLYGDEFLFLNVCALCNNASLEGEGSGDTTEIALLNHAKDKGVDLLEARKKMPRLQEWPFESIRKRMSVAIKIDGHYHLYTKGAPEAILESSKIDQQEKEKIAAKASEYSANGMRVLALAYKEYNDDSFLNESESEVEDSLTFLGLVAISDPPRVETIPSIQKCQKAGIRIIMITGDHPQTAQAIAHELGIIKDATDRVITGTEIDKLSKDELSELVSKVSVYARVSPENKLDLINCFKKKDYVVAMTGDGVNDALALKSADIGVAMGKGGTEVARQASAMILTDDNFATIVDAVEEGRGVHGNIKRTLQYLLSTNLGELLFILIASFFAWPVPLLPITLLWINLVTDGLPALALAAEKVPKNYLEETSKPTGKSFFDKSFITEMLLSALLITSIGLVLYWWGLKNMDIAAARTIAFNYFVFAVLFRSFASRSETRTFFELKPNPYHLVAFIGPLIFQFFAQSMPFLQNIFKITELSIELNFYLILLALVPLSLLEIYKLMTRKKHNK